MKNLSLFIFFISSSLCFSQKDTISSFNVKSIYDRITKQTLYYEKIDLKKSIFDDNNFKIIKNKVIKSGNLSLKYVENGILIKEISTTKSVIKKTTKLFDGFGNHQYSIYCENSKLKSIEKYEKNKLILRCTYGLESATEEYAYNENGYTLKLTSDDQTETFALIIDFGSQEVISKNKISSEQSATILKNDKGYYFVDSESISDKIYEKLQHHCH